MTDMLGIRAEVNRLQKELEDSTGRGSEAHRRSGT